MTALPKDVVADLRRRIAELEQRLQSGLAERDEAIAQQAAGARVWQSGPVGERGVEIVQIGNVDLPVLAKHRSRQIAPADPELLRRNF